MTAPSVSLFRPLSTTTYEFAGTVKRGSRRDALLVVLTSLVEHGGAATASELGEHLLGGGRVAMAERLLRSSAELGLVEGEDGMWWLTPAGVSAVADGHVLTPEFGVWRLVVAEDDLLDSTVVSLSRTSDPRLFEGTKSARLRRSTAEQFVAQVSELIGSKTTTLQDPTSPIEVVDVDSVAQVDGASGEHRLVWDPLAGRIAIDGSGKTIAFSGPTIAFGELASMVEPELRWDAEAAVSRIPAESLDDQQIMDGLFSRLVDESVELTPYGHFERVQVTEVPVGPIDANDADEWCRRRMCVLASDYAIRGRWDSWTAQAVSGLCPEPPRPSRGSIAERLACDEAPSGRQYWFVQAAVDWDV